MVVNLTDESLLRLPEVLAVIPVSRSVWWSGCKSGRFPRPLKIGTRTSVWKGSDIIALRERIFKGEVL